jgi:WD40 repeat protein/tRNA A-37 threonylcarbamoyl transferase component Bud32
LATVSLPGRETTPAATTGAGNTPPLPPSGGASIPLSSPPGGPQSENVPGYEILSELGRGGMGVVYKARQTRLGRVVALKMILSGSHAGKEQLARFRTEAEALARLQHPNIVQVFEVGESEGRPYFSLEFCEGGSLDRKLAGVPLPPEQAAPLCETVARAIAAAHRASVIHRDLKPANVLLTVDGTPKVTDFGLAKKLDEAGQTHTGEVMGTPSYMAPEQAEGKKEIGPAADVYALGAMLYEMLTGRPPFRAATTLETLMQVVLSEPVPPRQLNTKVPRDLETICLKCLAKECRQRYASAEELAEDLRRWREGEPIQARHGSVTGRLWRKAHRHRVPAASLLAVLLVLAVAGIVALSARHTRRLAALQSAFEVGLDAEDWTPQHLASLDGLVADLERLAPEQAATARQRLEERLVASLRGILRRGRLESEDVDRFDSGLRFLADHSSPETERLRRELGQRRREWETVVDLGGDFTEVDRVFWAADVERKGDHLLRRAMTGHSQDPVVLTKAPCEGNVELEAHFDSSWTSAEQVGLLLSASRGHTRPARMLAFAPNGRTLASASWDGTVILWDVAAGLPRLTLRALAEAYSVAFSADGRQVLAGTRDRVEVWDAATGQARASFPAHAGAVLGLAVSPDGQLLATGGDDGQVRLWDGVTLKEQAVLRGHTGAVSQVAFTRDGTTLASAGNDRTVRFWDIPGRTAKAFVARHPREVWCLAFAPDGHTLAAASEGMVKLWDVVAGKERLTIPLQPAASACGLAFAPDGKTLVIGNYAWDVLNGRALGVGWLGHNLPTTAVTFSGDGARLGLAQHDGRIVLWDPSANRAQATLGRQSYAFLLSAASAAGKRSIVPSEARSLGAVLKAGGRLHLQILRNGACLREQALEVPASQVRLRARREGDRLHFQVNDLEPVVFQDAFALRYSPAAVFGAHWPAGVRLTSFRARHQALSQTVSPLELGDEKFAVGRYEEALAAYQSQGVAAGTSATGLEARHKAALCLLHLNRAEEAASLFEGVAAEAGERWPLLAAFRLWLLRLEQGRSEEAEAAFTSISTRFRFEELLAVLPSDARQEILRRYDAPLGQSALKSADPLVRDAERADAVADFLQVHPLSRAIYKQSVIHAYQEKGDSEKALQVAEKALLSFKALPADEHIAASRVLTEYCWMQRLRGKAKEARAELDGWIFEPAGGYRKTAYHDTGITQLLLERVRLDVALEEWDVADKDLAACFRLLETVSRGDYFCYSTCHLMRGFLCERRGDLDGAKASWRGGLLKAWREKANEAARTTDTASVFSSSTLHNWIMASLADELGDAEAGAILQSILGSIGDRSVTQFATTLGLKASRLRTMWQGRHGRDTARKIAFRALPWKEYLLAPAFLLGTEVIREGALGGELSGQQAVLLGALFGDLIDLHKRGQFSKTQALQLGLAWKGLSGALGWGAAARTLKPAQRGPLAYFMACRYLHAHKKPAVAEAMLHIALADAPPDSSLKRLAQAALDQSRAKSTAPRK